MLTEDWIRVLRTWVAGTIGEACAMTTSLAVVASRNIGLLEQDNGSSHDRVKGAQTPPAVRLPAQCTDPEGHVGVSVA